MKIILEKLICPFCGREYENKILLSYSSMFAESAKYFMDTNKEVNECEDCKVELIAKDDDTYER